MIVAIVSKKGGVGKTTTAVSLSAALAAQGRRVLLVDCDPQASASLWLGVKRANLAPSVADVLLNGTRLEDALRPTATRGLELLTSSADLLNAERELASRRERDIVLRQRVRAAIENRYDYVFIDTPAGMSLLTVNAMVAADAFLVPATPDFLALEGLDNLLQATERIAFRNRVRLPCLGIVLTKVDHRTRLSKDTALQIRGLHGSRVFTTEIHGNVRIAEAPAFGQTIFEYDAQSRSASDYRQLATEVDLRRQRHQGKPSPTGPSVQAPSSAAQPTATAQTQPAQTQPAQTQAAQAQATQTRPVEKLTPPSSGDVAVVHRRGDSEESAPGRSARPIWLRGLGGLAS